MNRVVKECPEHLRILNRSPRFQVGDRVRLIDKEHRRFSHVVPNRSQFGDVVGYTHDGFVMVQHLGNDFANYWDEDSLECIDEPWVLIPTPSPRFKVGDKVKLRDDYKPSWCRPRDGYVTRVTDTVVYVDHGDSHPFAGWYPKNIEFVGTRTPTDTELPGPVLETVETKSGSFAIEAQQHPGTYNTKCKCGAPAYQGLFSFERTCGCT